MAEEKEDNTKKNKCIVCQQYYSDAEFDKGINECIGCYYESTDE